ncbi:hypothetical protein TCAL_14312 [Tigriopus californicus]|uniref:MICOS complex subunit MIC60 n=1 Tax=Tigriopus californicus TaxID=6832 RepID=A0A553NCV7_TIGCA|nr:MICOS complex subunit Mic60-like [Tigriopus californicus]TRY63267.1 hypothetical protein TCAL_14312 [Tigriopus californicus]
MFRSSSQTLSRSWLQRASPRHSPRPKTAVTPGRGQATGPSAPSPAKSGSGKVWIGLTLSSLAVVGGGVAYAGQDADFRRLAEETVPGASSLLSLALGQPDTPNQVGSAQVKPSLPVTTTPPSKKRSIPPVSEVKPKTETTGVAAPPAPPLEKPSFLNEKPPPEAPAPPIEPAKPPQPPPPPPAENAPEPAVAEPPAPQAGAIKAAPAVTREVPPEAPVDRESVRVGQDLHRRLGLLREEMESEMKHQLKRQSEAHTDHLTDALDVQRRELTRTFVRELDETLESATLKQREELAGIVGHLKGLQMALEARSSMDMAALEAQELWLACSSLEAALNDSQWLAEVRPLKRELDYIKDLLKTGVADEYVKTVMDAIPAPVADRGVFTESSIRERFLRVETMAKRTALMGEEGGSMVTYLLSYLQSLFILSPATTSMPSKFNEVQVDDLSTFDIVWLARAALDRGDLEQAVKYMNLLQGQPKLVAQDWIHEARILLETKQASRALILHAAAIGVEALPQRPK